MKRLFPIFLAGNVLLLIVFSSVGLAASPPPYPKVSYKADFSMTFVKPDGRPSTAHGKLYAIKDKERREIMSPDGNTIFIKDRAKGTEYTLLPEKKMYMVHQESEDKDESPMDMARDGKLVFKRVGTDRINGQSVIKYKIESTGRDMGSFSGYAWLTKQNIPVRFTATAIERGMQHKMKIDYTNIVIGRQNPKLFIVPNNYKLLQTGFGGMIPGQGMTPPPSRTTKRQKRYNSPPSRGPGMTPEQLEQMTRGMTPEQKKQFEQMMKSVQQYRPKE